MSARSRPGKGVPVTFGALKPEERKPSNLVGLRFTIDAQIRGQVEIDFSQVRPRAVAVALASAIFTLASFPGPWRSAGTIKANARHLKRFCAFLEGEQFAGPITDLTGSHVARYESQIASKPGQTNSRQSLACLIVALRELSDRHGCAFSEELEERTRYITTVLPARSDRPRDAYSDYVADQLRRAAAADIKQMSRGDREYSFDAFDSRELKLIELVRSNIRSRGFIRYDDEVYREYFWRVFNRGGDSQRLLNNFHREVFLSSEEIVPFLVFISTQSGLEVECCKWLRADCLEVIRPGYARLKYWKGRARGSEAKSIIVRDGGLATVGGAIRALLTLTEHARAHLRSEYAICYFNQGRILEGYRQAAPSVSAWVSRHGIKDDDGGVLHLQLSRLRKTYKSERYRHAGGELAVFVQGHTKDVAVNNYAEIPAHEGLHQRVVASALRDALRPSKVEVQMAGDGDPVGEESWLARCTSFTTGSHSLPGRPCEHPFWGCLNCTNARYSVAHLPAILAFAAFLRERRKVMAPEEWGATFGSALYRIEAQILPRYPDGAIAEAAEVARGFELYLPAEALQ